MLLQNADRLCPRPDWAPPAAISPATIQLYVTGAPTDAWAVVAVRGGDARRDSSAAVLFDAGGPVQGAPHAPQQRAQLATQRAGLAALDLIENLHPGPVPVLLRAHRDMTTALAGMTPPSPASEDLRRKIHAVSQQRPVWLAGWEPGRGYWWGDRAVALAAQCDQRSWGPQPPAWNAVLPLVSLMGDSMQCSVCLEDFSDPLPRPRGLPGANRSRSSDAFHGCPRPHAACVDCDRLLAGQAQPKCPVCRRPRMPWATLT